ncbi:uncharacterized protein [Oryza sativa Japonica Group]|uniref:uncharacterized protein n=1 Tax=Oryza sativa subsp. japonica TaxID=39947 RepID=UPI00339BD0DB
MYTLSEISAMPISAFQGGATYSATAKITAILSSIKWYYIGCHRCDKGYINNSDSPRCACEVSFRKPMYKLPVTITDESGSLDAVAFSFVAEDLVELDAAQASQNMKIDPADHPTTLNNAIGKTKIFAIGMNTDTSSKFPISYVLKKSFTIEPTMSVPMLTDGEPLKNKEVLQLPPPAPHTDNPSTTIHNTGASSKSTPPEISLADKTPTEKTSSTTKRAIDFTKDSIEETRSIQRERLIFLKTPLREPKGIHYFITPHISLFLY